MSDVLRLRPADTRPCGCPVDGPIVTPCQPTDPFHVEAEHWLLFNADREVVGCHCGFKADMDADCGYGDSVVEHLLSVGAA